MSGDAVAPRIMAQHAFINPRGECAIAAGQNHRRCDYTRPASARHCVGRLVRLAQRTEGPAITAKQGFDAAIAGPPAAAVRVPGLAR